MWRAHLGSSPIVLRLQFLLNDLAKALRVERATLRVVEMRLGAEYVTFDVLPPNAFEVAGRLDRLIRM